LGKKGGLLIMDLKQRNILVLLEDYEMACIGKKFNLKAEYKAELLRRYADYLNLKKEIEKKNFYYWQTIDTAPKDGTEILVCNTHQGNVKRLIWWSNVYKCWQTKGEVITNLQDTHWLKIPTKKKEI
jgi:hypothetical protein